jgi:DhnA family fructose-bisphosphate aldolase class Ia
MLDKNEKKIAFIDNGISNLHILSQVENEKALTYKFKAKIIPYVMTYEGFVTKLHKKYRNEIRILLRLNSNTSANVKVFL